MMRVLLDANVYDALGQDADARSMIRKLIDRGVLHVIATPMVLDELRDSPFGGLPDWFSVDLEAERKTCKNIDTYRSCLERRSCESFRVCCRRVRRTVTRLYRYRTFCCLDCSERRTHWLSVSSVNRG